MILFPHILVGAAVGVKTKKYWLIPIAAFISHLLLDTIPVWEYDVQFIGATNYDLLVIAAKAAVDLWIGVALIYFILRGAKIKLAGPAMLGAFFGLLPDGFTFLYFLLRITFGWNVTALSYFLNFHSGIQFEGSGGFMFWRVAAEATVAAAALFILWSSRRVARGAILKTRPKNTAALEMIKIKIK